MRERLPLLTLIAVLAAVACGGGGKQQRETPVPAPGPSEEGGGGGSGEGPPKYKDPVIDKDDLAKIACDFDGTLLGIGASTSCDAANSAAIQDLTALQVSASTRCNQLGCTPLISPPYTKYCEQAPASGDWMGAASCGFECMKP